MSVTQWNFTDHALERMAEMETAPAEVFAALDDPVTSYPSPRRYPGCRVAVRDRVAVPFDPRTRTVITVLWNTSCDGGRAFVRGQDDPPPPSPPQGGTAPPADQAPSGQEVALIEPAEPASATLVDRAAVRRSAASLSYADLAYIESDTPLCLDCGDDHVSVADALACDARGG